MPLDATCAIKASFWSHHMKYCCSLRVQTRRVPWPWISCGHRDKIWLRGTDGQKKMLSVTTVLTNFLKLLLINKQPVGVAAQGKPQAIFQLVSTERQIGILYSTLREESENKSRGGAGEGDERIRLCFAEEHVARAKKERDRQTEREIGGRPREEQWKMSRRVSLFSGVSRLNDCDSNLGKTTFEAETDR